MNDVDRPPVRPVLAVAGGAGTMGSLFAELLLPHVDVCLIIDRFPTAQTGEDGQRVALAPLVDRLTAALTRQGHEVRLMASGRPNDAASPLIGRDVRSAPAWLVARPVDARAPWPTAADLAGDTMEVVARVRRRQDIRTVVGLLAPADAEAASRLTDVLLVATHYGDDQQFEQLLAPYAAGIAPGALVADLLSIKEAPVRALCRLFPASVGVLGMHPLFGRVTGDVTGLVVAVVPAPDGRAVVGWQPWLLSCLTRLGLLITPTSMREHDAAMSYVQTLPHFALLCFAYTFVRANQDPTLLLPYRTPVFEPLLYLAARVAALAQRSPEVYGAIQTECTRPEVRRLFVETAQELLAAIEGDGDQAAEVGRQHPKTLPDRLSDLFLTLGAPWTPAYHQDAALFEQLVAMSGTLTEPINALRHTLLRSAGQIKAIRNTRTGVVTLGAVYVDPLHHDRVDLASRLRFQRFNLTSGTLDGPMPSGETMPTQEARRRLEARLGSLPLAQVQLLSDAEMLRWLHDTTGPRSGPDDYRGAAALPSTAGPGPRQRYAGKAHLDLSLAVPAWFDDDCLARLLVGRSSGSGEITLAQLAPQEATGLRLEAGRRAAIVRLACVLYPQEVLALRVAADAVSNEDEADRRQGSRRRDADRRFARYLTERQTGLRQMALDWLLAHGCAVLRRE